jgi:hypothetical protein
MSNRQGSRVIHTNNTLEFANFHSTIHLGRHELGGDLSGIGQIDCFSHFGCILIIIIIEGIIQLILPSCFALATGE